MRLSTLASVAVLAVSTAGLAQVVAPIEQKVPTGNTSQSGNDMAIDNGAAVAGNSDAMPDANGNATVSNAAGDPIDASGPPSKRR